jgi:Icc protein
LFADKEGALRGVNTYASLWSVLEHYRGSDWRADVAVVSGDLIQDDSREAYGHFTDLMSALALPVYCLPGNHDLRPLMQEALAGPSFHYCTTFERDDWLIACLDSCEDGRAGGALAATELDRFDSLVAGSAAAHVAVFLHHPPVRMGSRWLDSVGLDNGDTVLRRFAASGRVRVAVFGHVHQVYDAEHHGLRVIATPSTCRQFAPGSDEFAVDDNPPAYRRFELLSDGHFQHELVWVN